MKTSKHFLSALFVLSVQSGWAASLPSQPIDGGNAPAPSAIGPSLVSPPTTFPAPCHDDPSCVPPTIAREFRGLWIASVGNIDWPSRPGLPPDSVRAELRVLLDRARSSGLNAVILQVRPSGDALYASELEPWSEYLTGEQGLAPRPWWDPLKFAVDEAHQRGLELHAWFNPYRARHSTSKSAFSRRHQAVARASLARTYGRQVWMDPGEPAVRAHTIRVILDVVKRYDIDGVHIDDYFYPYKEMDRRGRPIAFPDSNTYQRYARAGGTFSRDDWRRENVNTLVRELYAGIHATKPWVKFGVSPFGIWRPGFPESVVGFDAYSELYADARKWLQEGWLDYFSPQLYWPVGQVGQDYPTLLRWWSEQNAYNRHLWPGNYTSKVGEVGRNPWRTDHIEAQIIATRAETGASGNVHFSASVFLEDRDSLATRLSRSAYEALALVPPSPWMNVPPQGDVNLTLSRAANGIWTARVAPTAAERPHWWLVQTRNSEGGQWRSTLLPGSLREFRVPAAADRVAVRAIDRASVEGPVVVMSLK